MERIRALWHGDVPLVRTYWLYGFLGGFLVRLPLAALINYPPPPSFLTVVLVDVYALFATVYGLFMAVAIWRSASKYPGPVWWAGLAKLMVVLGLARVLMKIVEALTGSAPSAIS